MKTITERFGQWTMRTSVLVTALTGAGAALAQIPDTAAGQKRAQVCFACHGENGVSAIAGTPHLAGQDRTYLVKALQSYRNGQRLDPTMVAMVKPLTDSDMVNIATFFNLAVKNARGQTLAAVIQTNERIKPVGTVPLAQAPSTPASPQAADAVYAASCAACHTSGAAGAPRLGDKSSWRARIAQGNDRLYANALKGLNAMPARGGCSDCTEEDIRKVVDYMVGRGK